MKELIEAAIIKQMILEEYLKTIEELIKFKEDLKDD